MLEVERKVIFNQTKICMRKFAKGEKVRLAANIIRKLKNVKSNSEDPSEYVEQLKILKEFKIDEIILNAFKKLLLNQEIHYEKDVKTSLFNQLTSGKLLKPAICKLKSQYHDDWNEIFQLALTAAEKKKKHKKQETEKLAKPIIKESDQFIQEDGFIDQEHEEIIETSAVNANVEGIQPVIYNKDIHRKTLNAQEHKKGLSVRAIDIDLLKKSGFKEISYKETLKNDPITPIKVQDDTCLLDDAFFISSSNLNNDKNISPNKKNVENFNQKSKNFKGHNVKGVNGVSFSTSFVTSLSTTNSHTKNPAKIFRKFSSTNPKFQKLHQSNKTMHVNVFKNYTNPRAKSFNAQKLQNRDDVRAPKMLDGHQKETITNDKLHPSWAAKKSLKQLVHIDKSNNTDNKKRIVFNDSD